MRFCTSVPAGRQRELVEQHPLTANIAPYPRMISGALPPTHTSPLSTRLPMKAKVCQGAEMNVFLTTTVPTCAAAGTEADPAAPCPDTKGRTFWRRVVLAKVAAV
jgi:hypothetical protein